MSTNLLSLAQEALGNDFSELAGSFLDESPRSTQAALSSLLPAVLGGIANKGATPESAASLMSLINRANLDDSSLGNIAGVLGSVSAINGLMKTGAGTLVPTLFGNKSGALVHALSSAAGIRVNSATNLIAMVVPLIFVFLKKFIGEEGLNASSLSSMLSSQGPSLQAAMDGRMTSALGFGSPAAFLSGLRGHVADGAKRVSTAVATTATSGSSGFVNWLPWVVGAVAVIVLWNLFNGEPRQTPTPVASTRLAALTPVASPTLAAAAPVLPAKVYFHVGSPALGEDGSKIIAAAAGSLTDPTLKVAVTGYTDRTGDAASNAELAMARAAAVRNALKAAGVADTQIEMRPPMFVEIGAVGSDAEARRVEIARVQH